MYHHALYCPRSLGLGTAERKGNTSRPSLVAGVGRIQPSITCDPTKNYCSSQLGTIGVREDRLGIEEKER